MNATPAPEQLTLLDVSQLPTAVPAGTVSSGNVSSGTALASSALPPRFRLDLKTRQRGLAHIAEIRRQAAARAAARAGVAA